MKIEISTTPMFCLHLTNAQARTLQKWALHHYDWVCQQAGKYGGFIYGWVNFTACDDQATTAPCRAAWREADTVLKICELFTAIPEDEARTLLEISQTLRQAMRESCTLTNNVLTVESS